MKSQSDPVLWIIAWFWIIILGIGWWIADHWITSQQNPNQQPTVTTSGEVILKRNRDGHYIANGKVNNHPVIFMIDTGATFVALSKQLARKLNLPHGDMININTANGVTIGFKTNLNTIQLGKITIHNVDAVFSDQMLDDIILLGMSFLKHIEFTQRNDRLFLRALPQNKKI